MTFNPLAASNSVESFFLLNGENKSALDIGAQTPSISADFIKHLINKYKHLNKTQITNLNLLKEKIINKKKFTTQDYFLSLGFKNYNSIDINGAYKSYKFDLNKDIVSVYKFNKKYDLVINNGTGEHVFNQHSLFLNMHNLTNNNGLMLHILPFIDWINHGFYNFNPIVFADLAASNNYDIVKLSFANRNAAEVIIESKSYNLVFEQIKPAQESTFFKKAIDFTRKKVGGNIILVVIFKKKNDNKFIIPLQGKYLADVEKSKTSSDYSDQKIGSGAAKNQLSDNLKRK
jgi:hypothetical protein